MPKQIQKTIIDTLGISDLPEEMQMELIESVGESVMQTMIVHAMETLPNNDCETLVKYLDEDQDIEKFFSFLEKKVPDINMVVQKAVMQFANA